MRNLTEVSLKNRVLVWYFIVMTALGGIFSYFHLGRMEDPSFTIREMIVTAAWPGASAEEMQNQVTDKLEKKLQDIPGLDHLQSETRPGQTILYVSLRDELPSEIIRPTWQDVRNFCSDIQHELPDGVYGPYYNDHFDDVYGSVYALTGDGFNYEELRQYAEQARQLCLQVPNVQKVELLGVQPERIYVEIENSKLAKLGLSPRAIISAIQSQAEMTPAGMLETDSDNVYLRLNGIFKDIASIRELPISADGKLLRLGDIATVERRFAEPAEPKMFFNGEPAVGIAISMEDGGNILQLGEDLRRLRDQFQKELPLGLELHQVSDQPAVVDSSIHDFVKTLFEAIVIVLAVSFFSLGISTGVVVAGCIPLVLAGVFCFMYILGIDLQKVSLGALIISLGLLVDDAIIAVEMMSVQLERGASRFDAACHAFRATAKPMLTGTLITCAGFIPVAFSKGMASEFCNTLFPVITIALLLSWIVSVMVAPLYGFHLIKVNTADDPAKKSCSYENRFYRIFRRLLESFLMHRKLVIGGTIVMFALSLWGMSFIKEEFFPPSTRPEIILDMKLPNGASMAATQKEADRLSDFLNDCRDELANYSYYVGCPAPRFVLTIDPAADADNYAQFVIVAKDKETRDSVISKLEHKLADDFPDVTSNIRLIQTGPPADYPIMLRVSAPTAAQVKKLAEQTAERVAADPNHYDVMLDWNEKSKLLQLELDQDKLHALGISAQAVAQTLYTEITGAAAAQFYTGDRTLSIDLRMAASDRQDISKLKNLPVPIGNGSYVPLAQIAKLSYAAEDGLIIRRDLLPTITVYANIRKGTANDATQAAYDATADLRKDLPLGCKITPAGALEDSEQSLEHLLTPIPAMIFAIMTLLMFQLRSTKKMLLTLATAPLGIIGVTAGMLLTDSALGFVADLGVLALSGMIIRNSVILIDQIQQHEAAGEDPWHAIVDSAVLRFRPIMLTAAAAILGMLPLMKSIFWGPMAIAIASGLFAATILTLLVLPAMYAEAYGVKKDS